MAASMLHGVCFGEEAGARNLVFFRVKWLIVAAAGDESYLLCAAVAAGVRNRFLLCVLQRVVVHLCVLLCAC